MQAIIKGSNEPGDLTLGEVARPSARSGNVLLEVAATGICGTDIHIYKGEYNVVPPVVIGHEVCGFICDTGEGVSNILIGKRVVSETFFSVCNVCNFCRNGKPNLCAQRKSIGTHVNGAMTSFVEVPAHGVHILPDWISSPAASLAEPLACITNGMADDNYLVGPGSDVLVIGPGAIGLLAAQVAQATGASVTVRGTPRDRARLDLAEKLGFAVQDGSDPIEEARFSAVVECSGSPYGVEDALKACGKRGHLVALGIIGKSATLSFDHVVFKELTVTSGFASNPRSWQRAMQLIADKKVDLEAMVSEVAPLRDWKRLFDKSMSAEGLKFVFDPRA